MAEDSAASNDSPPARRLSRRALLKWAAMHTGIGLAMGGGIMGYAFHVEPHWLRFVRRVLPIAGLPQALVGRTLAQLSDIHVGAVVSLDYLLESVQALAARQPDIIVLTGDLTNAGREQDFLDLGRFVAALPPSPLGNFAILGNHDYSQGWSSLAAANRVTAIAEASGVRVLRNQVADVQGLQLVGLDDFWSPRFNPTEALSHVDETKPRLLLCHNPDAADVPQMAAQCGWMLCGHTHGGQCRPPFLPPPLLPVANRAYTQGEIDTGRGLRLYINPGLGYLRKVRFNVRPEITLFEMTRA